MQNAGVESASLFVEMFQNFREAELAGGTMIARAWQELKDRNAPSSSEPAVNQDPLELGKKEKRRRSRSRSPWRSSGSETKVSSPVKAPTLKASPMKSELRSSVMVKREPSVESGPLQNVSFRKRAAPPPPELSEVPVAVLNSGRAGPVLDLGEVKFNKRAVPPPSTLAESSREPAESYAGGKNPGQGPRKPAEVSESDPAELARSDESHAVAAKLSSASGAAAVRGSGKSGLSSAEVQAQASRAVGIKLLEQLKFVELLGLECGARAIADNDEKLIALFSPRAPGTGANHSRLFEKFLEFLIYKAAGESRGIGWASLQDRKLSGVDVFNWTLQMVTDGAGRCTPLAGLRALAYVGGLFDCKPIVDAAFGIHARKIAVDYSLKVTGPPDRADGHPVKLIMFAERMAVCKDLSAPDRLTMGKLRVCQGASVRHDDLGHVAPSACMIILRPGTKEIRAIVGYSMQTKSGPRHWVVSGHALDSSAKGWLEETWKLVLQCHGQGLKTADYFGKMPDKFGRGWLDVPASHQSDSNHVRRIMLSYGNGLFSPEEAASFRYHGAKVTLTSVAQHLKVDSRAIDVQGGWKSQKTGMQDTYLRDRAIIALEAQEKCLVHLATVGDDCPKPISITAEHIQESLGEKQLQTLLERASEMDSPVVRKAARLAGSTLTEADSPLVHQKKENVLKVLGLARSEDWQEPKLQAALEGVLDGRFGLELVLQSSDILAAAGKEVTYSSVVADISERKGAAYENVGAPAPEADDEVVEFDDFFEVVLVNTATGKFHKSKGQGPIHTITACGRICSSSTTLAVESERFADWEPTWSPCRKCFPQSPESGDCVFLCGVLHSDGKQCNLYCCKTDSQHEADGDRSVHYCAFHMETGITNLAAKAAKKEG